MSTIKEISRCICFTLFAGLLYTVARAQEKKDFIIRGDLKDMKVMPEKVYLVYDTSDYHPTDSAKVYNGEYSFSGSLDGVSMLIISGEYFDKKTTPNFGGRNQAYVYIDGGTVGVRSTGDWRKTQVTGSAADRDFHEAARRMEQMGDTLRQMAEMAIRTQNDALRNIVLQKALNEVGPLAKQDYPTFIRQHPASVIDLFLLNQLMEIAGDGWIDSVATLYRLLPVAQRSNRRGEAIGHKLDIGINTAIGHQAQDFTENDTEGHPVSLSSFKGKYVFLDFWASWDNNAARALPILARAGDLYGR
jgi:hypothetical protein